MMSKERRALIAKIGNEHFLLYADEVDKLDQLLSLQKVTPDDGIGDGDSTFTKVEDNGIQVSTVPKKNIKNACAHENTEERTIHGLTGEYVSHCLDCGKDIA